MSMDNLQDAFHCALAPSRWGLVVSLLVHAAVFWVILFLPAPVIVRGLAAMAVLALGARMVAHWAFGKGQYAVTDVLCTEDLTWMLRRGKREGYEPVTLRSYHPTPLGVVLTWREQRLNLPFWRQRFQHTIYCDQVNDADYRWLKVLLSGTIQWRATRRSAEKRAVSRWFSRASGRH